MSHLIVQGRFFIESLHKKMKFSIMDSFSKRKQIRRKLVAFIEEILLVKLEMDINLQWVLFRGQEKNASNIFLTPRNPLLLKIIGTYCTKNEVFQ